MRSVFVKRDIFVRLPEWSAITANEHGKTKSSHHWFSSRRWDYEKQ